MITWLVSYLLSIQVFSCVQFLVDSCHHHTSMGGRRRKKKSATDYYWRLQCKFPRILCIMCGVCVCKYLYEFSRSVWVQSGFGIQLSLVDL